MNLFNNLMLKFGSINSKIIAVRKLGKLGNTTAVGPLHKAFSKADFVEEKKVKMAAALSLGAIGNERALKVLDNILLNDESHGDYEIITCVVSALQSIKQGGMEVVIKCLNHKDNNIVRYVANALAKVGDRRAIKPLVEALYFGMDLVHDTVESALLSIDQQWNTSEEAQKAIDYLINVIEKSENWVEKRNATRALGKIWHKDSLKALIKFAKIENNEYGDLYWCIENIIYHVGDKVPSELLKQVIQLKPIKVIVNYEEFDTGEHKKRDTILEFSIPKKAAKEKLELRSE